MAVRVKQEFVCETDRQRGRARGREQKANQILSLLKSVRTASHGRWLMTLQIASEPMRETKEDLIRQRVHREYKRTTFARIKFDFTTNFTHF